MALAELDGLDGLSLVASLASARSAAACVSQTRQKFKFICVTCKKSFKYNSDLKRHERVHTGEKPFKCDMCSKSYQQKEGFSNMFYFSPFYCEILVSPLEVSKAKNFKESFFCFSHVFRTCSIFAILIVKFYFPLSVQKANKLNRNFSI